MEYSSKTVVKSLTFKFAEQIAAKITSLIVSIVLARLLNVADFGVVAILTVFVHISSAIIEGGLSTSLIQKKQVDDVDYSTVFYTSLGLAVVLYSALFFCAPIVANIYDNVDITSFLRVIGVVLFVAPFNTVQLGYVYKHMQFKRLLIATLTASIVSGGIGIWMAYTGKGAWALVTQTIVNSTLSSALLFLLIEWKPKLLFSMEKLKSHFSYGWKLLVSSLLETLYNEMRSLIIGKRYTSEDLAYYNRGDSYPKLLMTSLNTSIQTVMFPVLSSKQDNKEQLKQVMRKAVAMTSFIVFPIMAGFAAVSECFVRVVLTDKWLFCVPYLQLACIIYAIQPINSCNLQAIKAIGRSDIYLFLDLLKKGIGFSLLFVSAFAFKTPMAIAIASAIYAPIQLLINALPNRKLIGYTFAEQMKDIALPLAMSLGMFISVFVMNYLPIHTILKLILQIITGVLLYLLFSLVFKVEALNDILFRIKHKRK